MQMHTSSVTLVYSERSQATILRVLHTLKGYHDVQLPWHWVFAPGTERPRLLSLVKAAAYQRLIQAVPKAMAHLCVACRVELAWLTPAHPQPFGHSVSQVAATQATIVAGRSIIGSYLIALPDQRAVTYR